jgi:diaminopimelate epimerase
MRVLNPDGSEAEKSGNGIRIFAKFLRDHGYTTRDELTIRTLGGAVRARLEWEDGRVAQVSADMGTATFGALDAIDVDGARIEGTAVSMGNPHFVVHVPDLARVDIHAIGPKIERHPAFPQRTNVQFAQVVSRGEVRAEIWERGAGYTLASGSSSCAVAAASRRKELVDRDVIVTMPGGRLRISVAEDWSVRMTGPVEEICGGELSADLLRRIRSG